MQMKSPKRSACYKKVLCKFMGGVWWAAIEWNSAQGRPQIINTQDHISNECKIIKTITINEARVAKQKTGIKKSQKYFVCLLSGPWNGCLPMGDCTGESIPLRRSGIGCTAGHVKPRRCAIPCSFMPSLQPPLAFSDSASERTIFYFLFLYHNEREWWNIEKNNVIFSWETMIGDEQKTLSK